MFVASHNGSRVLGGGETGTALLLAGLQARGHRVLMLCRDAEMAGRVAAFAGIPTDVQRVGGDASVPDALRFAARLRRERPDAVILTTFKKVLLAGLGARLARVPFVVQRIVLEGDTPRAPRYRFALRHLVDAITLNAAAMRPPFLAGDARLDPAKVVTLLDGVEAPPRTREPGAVRRELGIPASAVVVGAVARLASQKRFDRLLRAAASLPSPVHVLLAGEGGRRGAIEAVAAELGMADRVHLPGFRTDVGDVLAALDLFVVSSDREGMANAMLEAMAAGVPVVSTDVSGAREALEAAAGEVPPGTVCGSDEASLAEAMASVLADPERLRAMGQAARARAEARFGRARFVDEWERLLEEGVRKGRGG